MHPGPQEAATINGLVVFVSPRRRCPPRAAACAVGTTCSGLMNTGISPGPLPLCASVCVIVYDYNHAVCVCVCVQVCVIVYDYNHAVCACVCVCVCVRVSVWGVCARVCECMCVCATVLCVRGGVCDCRSQSVHTCHRPAAHLLLSWFQRPAGLSELRAPR